MSRNFSSSLAARFFMLLATSLFVVFAHAQGAPKSPTVLDPPQPTPSDGSIEVLEFFAYGCIACANLEPALEEWSKTLPPDVKFRRVPAGFNFMGIEDVPVFHTLEAMGKIDVMHKKIFTAAHNERVMLGHRPTYLKWLEKQGIDPAQYESVEKSFSVHSKIMRGRGLASQYKITSTPTLVINGRHLVQQTGDAKMFLATVVDRMVAEARAANAAPAKAAKPRPETKVKPSPPAAATKNPAAAPTPAPAK